LGYKNPNNALFIGFDKSGWFWEKYNNTNSSEWYRGSRIASPENNVDVKVDITWNGSVATLTVDGQKAFDVDYSSMLNILSNKIAIKAASYGTQYTDMLLRDPNVTIPAYTVSGRVLNAQGDAIANANVQLQGKDAIQTNASGEWSYENINPGTYTVKFSAANYEETSSTITVSDADILNQNVTLQDISVAETEVISSAEMEVLVHKYFPAVRQYTMKNLNNRIMYGQPKEINTIIINDTPIQVTRDNVAVTIANDKATYVLKVIDESNNINALITSVLTVKKNTLHFDITKIVNNAGEEYPIESISIPNHNLVSVRAGQDKPQFTGARMSSDTRTNGDTNIVIDNNTTVDPNKADYAYGFVSADSLSAGLWSNSEHDGTTASNTVGGGAKNTRVVTSAQRFGAENTFGLSSATWYYHRKITDSKKKTYTLSETDMPKAAVAITGDANEDGVVNWEDGAIAYRDIMNNPYKSEVVPELVAWRIAMNFGGQAQNPFPTTLDNVKKVALNTDGLGQSILLKGYGNEGHDSGHPDYGDIGARIGGAKDMNTMMDKGAQYGARFGIHINASEMYPEAKAFNENLVRRNANGGLSYGWNWIDQGIGIDGAYDLASNSRVQRLADLKKQIGDRMDFIYLDVWGNYTSGAEDSLETRKMSKMINDNGWRMTTEWGAGNEYDSTFQHWAADLTYGGAKMKGQNSQVMRFLRNHQKDSWVGDYPSYGGTANAPLLGGYNMKDFEGWQGRNDYDAYIANLFTHNVSTKFIQHFKVTRWVNSPVDLTSAYDTSTNNGNEFIELKDNFGNVVTLIRGSNNAQDEQYRHRTITLNGKVIAQGAVNRGDNNTGGTESYLIPWLWDVQTGKIVESKNEKLYHWNTNGGTTTWQLPDSWTNLANVKVYKLTDLGKTEESIVPVSAGSVTLTVEAQTPYVVYKGDTTPKQLQIAWSEGMHIVDAGFNGGVDSLQANWTKKGSGEATIAKSQFSNPMLKLTGSVAVSQKITDLSTGKRYALYVGVDNRSDGKAILDLSVNGKTIASNYTKRSIAKNYIKAYAHNTNSATVDGSSYFQHMYVFFEAPDNGDEVLLTLKHLGAGDVYFDDVRVVENAYTGITTDDKGQLVSFVNDFENNAQGIWPFVVGGSEGVEDNRIHLSELHAPYTQAGWDVKKMDDVLGGTWSVKVNGLVQKGTILYQTIPQNIRFAAGKTYKVSFDYQSGSDDIYALAVGHGMFDPKNIQIQTIPKALGTTSKFEFELTGNVNEDSWFGIISTRNAPDLQGTTDAASNFGGYKDFVLDNIKVERVQSQQRTEKDVQNKYDELNSTYDSKLLEYNDDVYRTYMSVLAKADAILEKKNRTDDDLARAYDLLASLENYMSTAPDNSSSDKFDIATNQYAITTGSEQPRSGKEGPADFAQDGAEDTFWHTAWSENAVGNGTSWYEFVLNEPTTITGLRYLPRPGSMNGRITRYNVDVTFADDSTKRIITDGEFTTDIVWQRVKFTSPRDATGSPGASSRALNNGLENVKKVRLTVTGSAGNRSTEVNKFATAAELRLTTPKDVESPTLVADKSELKDVYEKVLLLKESAYTPQSWNNLSATINDIKAVLDNDDATLKSVALAEENLNAAMNSLVLAPVSSVPPVLE
ncbi:MAG: endo-alpha-N-acetylgalactosaminidase family protein, partial [Bifidobacteriaceae bacterium]|nr:endo-alpha-N-acetylgalactosaminidase family protein [Bifidobacteriaceae bacterium]